MTSFLPPVERARLNHAGLRLSRTFIDRSDGVLLVIPEHEAAMRLARLPYAANLKRALAQRGQRPRVLLDLSLPSPRDTRLIVGLLARGASPFAELTLASRMVKRLTERAPARVGLATDGAGSGAVCALLAALRAATEAQPSLKSKVAVPWRIRELRAVGATAQALARTDAWERGAHLARWLTALPPNVLTPASYRSRLAALARRYGWRMRVLSRAALKRRGAGAFLAVDQGSDRHGGIVHLSYRPKRAASAPVALIGKGLCFDTGGSNLKSAAAMLDMHIDMAGSAVAVGTLASLSELDFPKPVDAWLALAENRLGPKSYLQQDVVKAANGVSIQVMHTDAEGRMVLADTLAIAAATRPAALIDLATLTGACVTALTARMSGAFTNRVALRPLLEAAGARSGERVWVMPMPEDYDEELESPIADVRQCLLDGKGDHIYAARFLRRFVPDTVPWVHIDLSAALRAGGLAHVASDITGFGVRLLSELLLTDHAALAGARR